MKYMPGKWLIWFLVLGFFACEEPMDRPNILWITSEDNGPYLGCYGDTLATTPNLDNLAKEGFRYTHAFANYPVCAPARNTILTGVYASSNGCEHMRSQYAMSTDVALYPELMRAAGYYCSNNFKTDYNFAGDYKSIWDASSREAHYKNRPDDRPFFAIFNLHESHEGKIHRSRPDSTLRHRPENIVLPPQHPDTKEMRHDWAQYYDHIAEMDKRVGQILHELDSLGEADNTIVFYYADHGGVLPLSKRFIYESGTHVPFIVRIPENFKHLYPTKKPGTTVNRLISWIDLAPTLLHLTGEVIPQSMQGRPFLGEEIDHGPDYVHLARGRMDERYDMCRAVRDDRYKYIRNYMPFRKHLQHLGFLFEAPSVRSWEQAYLAGQCDSIQERAFKHKPFEELYDLQNDPHETINLANHPDYTEILDRMRNANLRWMEDVRDVGLIPETEFASRIDTGTMYDYMRSDDCPFDELLRAAELATLSESDHMPEYIRLLSDDDSAIRYWGAMGILSHIDEAETALPALLRSVDEPAPATATLIAESLYQLDQKGEAINIYQRLLSDPGSSYLDRNFALNSVDATEIKDPIIMEFVREIYATLVHTKDSGTRYRNDVVTARYLLQKWAG